MTKLHILYILYFLKSIISITHTTNCMCCAGMSNPEVIQNLERGYRMPKPENSPDALYNVMCQCWNEGPEDRPTFEYLRSVLEDFSTATERQYQE